MDKKDQTTENYPEREDQSFYQTGSTRPAKSRGGLIAVLLAAVIFLGGIFSILGLLKIRLFQPADRAPEDQDPYVQFSPDATEQTGEKPENTGSVSQENLPQLELKDSPQGVENIPQEGGLSLQDIYEKAIDSVVSITGSTGSGTGVILSTDGYIITNCHVVEDTQQLSVLLSDQRVLPASVTAMDPVSDLAVLSVDADNLTPAVFGDSGTLRVGDSVVAIGDPLGVELRGTMTNGIISAINRDISTGGRTMTLIQTNAALNSGNSGGPLLNCYGQVIGINTMKIGDYMSSAGVEGLGFAIPSATVKEIVDQLLTQGYVSGRPDIGFTGEDITSFDQMYYRFPKGVYITHVDSASDAAAKGLVSGDILLQFEDTRVSDTETLESLLYSYNAGDAVDIIIYRNGNQYALTITLEEAR